MADPLFEGHAPPRIVCAAQRDSATGKMVVGPRHYDATMRAQMKDSALSHDTWRQSEGGFIDQFGRFLTREEAWVIAVEQNQIFSECGPPGGGRLYSEHLY